MGTHLIYRVLQLCQTVSHDCEIFVKIRKFNDYV